MSDPRRYRSAGVPDELERLFVERVNAGDVEGLVALYERDAVLASDDGRVIAGEEQLRRYFVGLVAGRPTLTPSVQAAALCSGNLALTSSRHRHGSISAEIARRQPDGTWLWVIDSFVVGPAIG